MIKRKIRPPRGSPFLLFIFCADLKFVLHFLFDASVQPLSDIDFLQNIFKKRTIIKATITTYDALSNSNKKNVNGWYKILLR